MSDLRKFYYFTSFFLIIGLGWIGYNFFYFQQAKPAIQVCILKNTSGLPCPSCGTTRSVLNLLHGDILPAILINPFGVFAFIGLTVIPFWILYDCWNAKTTLWIYYLKFINSFSNKKFSFVVIILILLNWIWNIQKGI